MSSKAAYGYDQRAEVLGTNAMIMTDNNYPNTAKIFSSEFCGNADMPFDFFMSRYKEAYILETLAFVDCLVNDKPSPCSGEDGLIALVMAIAAGKSAEERRWVQFSELGKQLCGLSGDLPVGFDLDACELVVEDSEKEGGSRGLNLGKLASILTNKKKV